MSKILSAREGNNLLILLSFLRAKGGGSSLSTDQVLSYPLKRLKFLAK